MHKGDQYLIIFSFTINSKKEIYQWNTVQLVKWLVISWRNRNKNMILSDFETMLWASNNQNIGGFYNIFPPNTTLSMEEVWAIWYFWFRCISLKQQQECVGGSMYSKIISKKLSRFNQFLFLMEKCWLDAIFGYVFNLFYFWKNWCDLLTLFSKLVE